MRNMEMDNVNVERGMGNHKNEETLLKNIIPNIRSTSFNIS